MWRSAQLQRAVEGSLRLRTGFRLGLGLKSRILLEPGLKNLCFKKIRIHNADLISVYLI